MVKNEIGNVYGKLTVLERNGSTAEGLAVWLCLCQCGKTVSVSGAKMRKGNTKSCGCLVAEKCIERSTTHGMSHTKQYTAWANMLTRCYKPTSDFYEMYGGRGIVVCEKWKTFAGFWEDMGNTWEDGLTIERLDFNGNYCKENCVWASVTQQARNKGINSNNKTGVNGVFYCERDNCYVAAINIQSGKKKRKNFSINKYGEDAAFKLACEWRLSQENLLKGTELEYGEKHGTLRAVVGVPYAET